MTTPLQFQHPEDKNQVLIVSIYLVSDTISDMDYVQIRTL